MKKNIVAFALMAVISGAAFAQGGFKPLGYPGSTWSQLSVNPSPIRGTPEDNNIILMGKIEQGVDWRKFGANKEWTLNTYASLGYSVDRNALAYNNKLVPAVGVKFRRSFDQGNLDLGVEVVHQNNFRGVTAGRSSGTGVMAYASYWFGWNLGK